MNNRENDFNSRNNNNNRNFNNNNNMSPSKINTGKRPGTGNKIYSNKNQYQLEQNKINKNQRENINNYQERPKTGRMGLTSAKSKR